MNLILFGFMQFIVPILVIGMIVAVVRKRLHRGGGSAAITVSREDNLSQLYMLISVAFLGVTLMSASRDFGSLLSWQTVFFATSAAGLAIGHYFRVIYLIPLSLIGLIFWWNAQAADWMDARINSTPLLAGPLLFFLLMYVLGQIQAHHGKWRKIGSVYSALALLAITGILFTISTSMGLELFADLFKGEPFFAAWQVSVSLLVFVLALFFAMAYALGKQELGIGEASVIGVFAALVLFMALAPVQKSFYLVAHGDYSGYGRALGPVGYMWAAALNLICFFELVGILFAGYYKKEGWLVSFAMFGLFFFIAVKYIDWFGTMLNRSVFFIGAGILLLVIGWFMEKGRRYMLRTMTEAPSRGPQLP